MTVLAFNENTRLSERSRHWFVRVMFDLALHVAGPAFAQLVIFIRTHQEGMESNFDREM